MTSAREDLPQISSFMEQETLYAELVRDRDGFLALSRILNEIAGIHLPMSEKNLSLMASRLSPMMRRRNLLRYQDYMRLLKSRDPNVIAEFVQALTTNTTSFFREESHFDTLREYLSERSAKMKPGLGSELRIWCAASSTGQEPYSIAMTVCESLPPTSSLKVRLLATDIDLSVLEKASRGIYTAQDLSRMDPRWMARYFEKRETAIGTRYVTRAILKDIITFAPLNLKDEVWPFRMKFDVIFCRNVLIYFERETVAQVVSRMTDALAPSGLLFLGHSETSAPKPPCLRSIGHAVWKKEA